MRSRLQAAIEDHQAGRLREAIAGYRDVLDGEDGNATAEAMLGVALIQTGLPNGGLRHLRRAVVQVPDDSVLLGNIGACLDQMDQREAACASHLRSAALSSGSGNALAAAGACFTALKLLPQGFRCLRRALVLSPSQAIWWAAAGDTVLIARSELAVACYRRAGMLGLDAAQLGGRLAEALLASDLYEEAASLFEERVRRQRASRWYWPELAATAGPATGSDSFAITSEPKLRHDIQQFEYLIARGLLDSSFEPIVTRYRSLLAQSPGRSTDGPCYRMTEQEQRSVAEAYNRIVHLHRAKPRSAVLGPRVDWKAAEDRYFASKAGILAIDDLLAPETLSEVRRICLESTVWFDDRHRGGYLGAFLRDGFCDPLLLQISRELGKRMPRIFRQHRLREMWAFKYDSRLEGIGLHADSAAVNVNFWITPDEAHLNKDGGGLVVFDQKAPADWEFEKYNNDQPAIRQFLADSGAERVVVPHRCNRAVIFHSDLFHRTDDLHFRDDYLSRRVNVTMLFGDRGD